jgi:hypothetical protein
VTAQPPRNSKKGFFVHKAEPFFSRDLPKSDHAGIAVLVNSFSALISESDGKIHGFIADAADWRLEELQDFCHWAAYEKGIIGSHKRLRPTV